MPLTSLRFIAFAAVLLALYNLVPARHRVPLLLAGSYGFYASFSVLHLLVLVAVTLITYGAVHAMSANRRYALPVSLGAVLLPLVALKYSAFVIAATADWFHSPAWLGRDVALPLGLSFFTFQAISYLVDVRRGTVLAERRFTHVALYLALFPKLLAGPVERARDLLPQLGALSPTAIANLHTGVKVALWGFFCKLVVADNLGSIVDAALKSPSEQSGATLCVAFVLYSFQIYFDFLGYTNIAIGVGRCFNVHLNRNFNVPYAATSLREFWRRWHVSVSSWFRDYVYVPLGGNKTQGGGRMGLLLLVFIVSGIWHGAAMTFVAWGAFHGIAYAIEDQWRERFRAHASQTPAFRFGRKNAQRVATFGVVTLGWILFRSADFSEVRTILDGIAGFGGSVPYLALNELLTRTDSVAFMLLLLCALWLDASRGFRAALDQVPTSSRSLLGELAYVNGFAVAILLLGDLGVRDFTYFRF